MARIPVTFEYLTGLRPSGQAVGQPITDLQRLIFRNARLSGSWDSSGRWSNAWSTVAMEPFTAEDGCPAYRATVTLDDGQIGWWFRWGVTLDAPGRPNLWGIPNEINDPESTERYRLFRLDWAGQVVRFYLTHCRRLGANKLWTEGTNRPAIRFAAWAPNARAVEVVMGETETGYIWPDGTFGPDRRPPAETYAMGWAGDGVWQTDLAVAGQLNDFAGFDHRPYMFRVTKDDGSVAYRTDLYSRCQIGSGNKDPLNPPHNDSPWNGTRQDLDGTKSCSVVVDPERVTEHFREVDPNGRQIWPEHDWLTEEDFWRNEFDPLRPVPARLEDLVIYELHVSGLGFGRVNDRGEPVPGTLGDAMALLDHLVDLGINCVELMPMAEFEGWANWGYGNSHYLAIEYAGGGRDQMKHFVRECHRRGIAVLLDVVYNHYIQDAERAEWGYDSSAHERNIYYWYEGQPGDYPSFDAAVRGSNPGQIGHGGYVDNMSTGYAPRFWEEAVRKMFISSAAMLVAEFHFDGFRVDQTTSLHSYAVLHADGRPAQRARQFGAKFLREWTRTVRMIRPNAILIAEDHSGWSAVTQSTEAGGLGFDATWYAEYYHQLIGDATADPSRARLLKIAGYGDNRSLPMTFFAGTLAATSGDKVIYHESHDEAGNSTYTEFGSEQHSDRTIVVAVNRASLTGETRRWAEARVHFAAGITLLGPGTPMFFMGEEVGAAKPYRYNDFLRFREDLAGERAGEGRRLFAFYQAVIRLRREHDALRSHSIDIVHVHDSNRIIAFRRWSGNEQMLVIAGLNNGRFWAGYELRNERIPDGDWQEVFNSDSPEFGGSGLTNPGLVRAQGGALTVRLPGNFVAVFLRR